MPLQFGLSDGSYVYVQDVDFATHVLIDGPHHHVRVLGRSAHLPVLDPTIQEGELASDFLTCSRTSHASTNDTSSSFPHLIPTCGLYRLSRT